MKKYKLTLILALIIVISCDKNPVSDEPFYISEENLLFVRGIAPNHSQICAIDPYGSALKIISEVETGDLNSKFGEAVWSPDKSKILTSGWEKESIEFNPIWIFDSYSGQMLYQLTEHGEGGIWAPDEREMMYSRRESNGTSSYSLYYIFKGREEVLFQSDSISTYATDYSPNVHDRNKLLLNIQRVHDDDRTSIGIFDIFFKSITYLVDNELSSFGAKWSPDGKKVAYISGSYTQGYNIFLFDSEHNTHIKITNSAQYYNDLVWSPDGKKLAFIDYINGPNEQNDIYVMDLITRIITNITDTNSKDITYHLTDWK